MRFRYVILAVISFVIFHPSVFAQSNSGPKEAKASSPSTSGFEPLDHWKAALLSGDKDAIAAFYSSSPASRSQTPQGNTEDPSEEPTYWSSEMSKGVSHLKLKVLEFNKPREGLVSLVFHVEMLGKNAGENKTVVLQQIWFQQGDQWRIVATHRSNFIAPETGHSKEPAKSAPDLYPPPEEAPAEIDAALQAASKDHKRVILVFGGNWCFDCHVLNENFHSKEIAPLVDANYHVVHVSIGDGDKNLDLAKKYDTPLDKGVPVLAVLDSDGKIVYSQKQGEFESSSRISPQDIIQFLQKWKAPNTH